MTPRRIALLAEGALVWVTAGALFLSVDQVQEATIDRDGETFRIPLILHLFDWIVPIGIWGLALASLIAIAYVPGARSTGPSMLRMVAWSLACFASLAVLCAVGFCVQNQMYLNGPRPVPIQRVIGNVVTTALAIAAAWWAWRWNRPAATSAAGP